MKDLKRPVWALGSLTAEIGQLRLASHSQSSSSESILIPLTHSDTHPLARSHLLSFSIFLPLTSRFIPPFPQLPRLTHIHTPSFTDRYTHPSSLHDGPP